MTANELLELPTTAQLVQAGEELFCKNGSISDIQAHRAFDDLSQVCHFILLVNVEL